MSPPPIALESGEPHTRRGVDDLHDLIGGMVRSRLDRTFVAGRVDPFRVVQECGCRPG